MALGPELITNGDFSGTWSASDFGQVPQDWIHGGYGHNATNYIDESVAGDQCQIINDVYNASYLQKSNVIELGKEYTLVFDMISLTSIRALRVAYGTTDTIATFNTPGVGLTATFTATFDNHRLFFMPDGNGAFDCVIDNVSLKEVLPDPPATTTVEVTWVDSISAAATGNKIYRDDVEIADIGMGVQTYNDETAEPGTTYKYEVQAYSATDETTQEVTGVNTDTITTA